MVHADCAVIWPLKRVECPVPWVTSSPKFIIAWGGSWILSMEVLGAGPISEALHIGYSRLLLRSGEWSQTFLQGKWIGHRNACASSCLRQPYLATSSYSCLISFPGSSIFSLPFTSKSFSRVFLCAPPPDIYSLLFVHITFLPKLPTWAATLVLLQSLIEPTYSLYPFHTLVDCPMLPFQRCLVCITGVEMVVTFFFYQAPQQMWI